MKVLVTCGGGFQGLTILKAIENWPNVQSYILDNRHENVARYFSDFFEFCDVELNSNEYKNFLFEFVKKNEIDYVIPATALDLRALSHQKSKFLAELNCSILVPEQNYIEIFEDKISSYQFFSKHSLPVQKLSTLDDLQYHSLLAKPNKGWGGKGIKRICSKKDFEGIDLSEYHLTKLYDQFSEYSIDFSVNFNGVISDFILRERVSVSGGFAVISQTSTKYYEKFENYLLKVQEAFSDPKFSGVYNIQFIDSEDGLFFTDLNSRIGTSAVMFSYNQGSLISHLLNQKTSTIFRQEQVKVVRSLQEKYFRTLDSKSIKGVVFDLDDTLISNRSFILARIGLVYDLLVKVAFEKKELLTFTNHLLDEGKAPFLIDELMSEFNFNADKKFVLESYRKCFPSSLNVYKDVVSTLLNLKSKGLRLYILTDNPVITQKNKIDLLPFRDLIDQVFYTSEIGAAKPSSLGFHQIVSHSKLAPSELVMVGDNQYRDMVGAAKSGYRYGFLIHRSDGLVGTSQHAVPKTVNFEQIHLESLLDLKEYL